MAEQDADAAQSQSLVPSASDIGPPMAEHYEAAVDEILQASCSNPPTITPDEAAAAACRLPPHVRADKLVASLVQLVHNLVAEVEKGKEQLLESQGALASVLQRMQEQEEAAEAMTRHEHELELASLQHACSNASSNAMMQARKYAMTKAKGVPIAPRPHVSQVSTPFSQEERDALNRHAPADWELRFLTPPRPGSPIVNDLMPLVAEDSDLLAMPMSRKAGSGAAVKGLVAVGTPAKIGGSARPKSAPANKRHGSPNGQRSADGWEHAPADVREANENGVMTVSPSVSPAGSGASAVAAARAAPIVPGNYSVVPQVTLNKRPQSAKTELLRTSASFPAAPSSSPDGARAGSNSPKAMTPPLERRHNRPPRPWSGRSDTSEHRPWSDAAREQLTTVGQPQLTTKQQQSSEAAAALTAAAAATTAAAAAANAAASALTAGQHRYHLAQAKKEAILAMSATGTALMTQANAPTGDYGCQLSGYAASPSYAAHAIPAWRLTGTQKPFARSFSAGRAPRPHARATIWAKRPQEARRSSSREGAVARSSQDRYSHTAIKRSRSANGTQGRRASPRRISMCRQRTICSMASASHLEAARRDGVGRRRRSGGSRSSMRSGRMGRRI